MAFTWDSNSGTIHVFLGTGCVFFVLRLTVSDGGAVAQGAGSLELIANNGRFTLGQGTDS